MAFPRTPSYVRNDSFGPSGHNNLLQRQKYLRDFHAVEHDPDTGEHSTPHVARSLGHVAWSGAAYSLAGFNGYVSLASGHNPAPGTIILTLAQGKFDPEKSIVEVQPADASGSTNPWVGDSEWLDANHLAVYLNKNGAALSTQQAFAGTDGDFFIAIRAPRMENAAARPDAAARRLRGEGLRVSTTSYNPLIQEMGDGRFAVLEAHTAAGLHDVREVAKVVANIAWDGADYQVRAHRGLEAGVQRIAAGQIRVFLSGSAPAMIAPVQAFVSPVSATSGVPTSAAPDEGGIGASAASLSPAGIRIGMVPAATCLPGSVDVFLFESFVHVNTSVFPAVTSYRWRTVDGSFGIRVHGA